MSLRVSQQPTVLHLPPQRRSKHNRRLL
jgi:hypothetical protein